MARDVTGSPQLPWLIGLVVSRGGAAFPRRVASAGKLVRRDARQLVQQPDGRHDPPRRSQSHGVVDGQRERLLNDLLQAMRRSPQRHAATSPSARTRTTRRTFTAGFRRDVPGVLDRRRARRGALRDGGGDRVWRHERDGRAGARVCEERLRPRARAWHGILPVRATTSPLTARTSTAARAVPR